jgi:hypothetical protein
VVILENVKPVEPSAEEQAIAPPEETDESKDVLTFKIDKDAIIQETEDPNRKIIKIKSKKNSIDKGYKITRPKTKKADEPMAGGRKKKRSAKRPKTRKRKTAKK